MPRLKLAMGITVLSVLALLRPVRAAAQDSVPPLIQISGDLADQKGRALSGPQTVTFALYKDQSGDAPLWVEVQAVTADSKGHFIALLGATSPGGLPLDLFTTGQARWLGMQASGQAEQARTFLASVPYALAPLSALTGGGQPVAANVGAPPLGTAAPAATASAAISAAAPLVPIPGSPPTPIATIVTDATSGLTNSKSGSTVTLSLITSCAAGQLLKWNGTAWGCTADSDVMIGVTGGGLNVLANAVSPNIVGGFAGNAVTSGAGGATIAGGGENSLNGGLCLPGVACQANNRVTQSFGAVGGGENNQAGDAAGSPGVRSFATVGGGFSNTASGHYATVPGGLQNTAAGLFSFAAGRGAKANHDGSFVWGDNSTINPFASSGNNQFLIRAAGGVGIGTNAPIATLDVRGDLNLQDATKAGVVRFPSTGGLFLRDNVNNLDRMFISGSSGYVGIGTNAPTTMLDVRGHLNLEDASNNGVFVFPSTGSGLFIRSGLDANYSERMFISGSTGRVGIGTTSPSQLLDVAGNANVAATMSAGTVSATIVTAAGPVSARNVIATDTVKGSQLCIGADCRSEWPLGGINFGGLQGSGPDSHLARWTNGQLGDSSVSDQGSAVSIQLASGGGGFSVLQPVLSVSDPTSPPPDVPSTPNIVGGFSLNSVSPNVAGATISGGGSPVVVFGDPNSIPASLGANTVTASYGTVGGGEGNSAGQDAVVAGGWDNVASGYASVVPGGIGNAASGDFSFAAGGGAGARHNGTFVWADQEDPNFEVPFNSTRSNQFLIRASGGVGIGTNAPTQALDVNGNVKANGLCIGTDCRNAWPSGSGTITGVTAGTGLAGGGTSGNVSLAIASAGVTNAMLQNSGVTLNAGPGLSGGGTVSLGSTGALSVDFSTTQQRVSGNCATGSAIRMVNPDGSVKCEPVVSTGLGGTGGVNFLTKFTSVSTLGSASIFDDGGNVGIGTTSPIAKLHVDGSTGGVGSRGAVFLTSDANATALVAEATNTGSGADNIGLFGLSAGHGGIGVRGQASHGVVGQSTDPLGDGGYFFNYYSTGKALVAVKSDQTEALTVLSSGNVGILNPTPSEALDVNGNVKAAKFIGDGSLLTNLPSGGGGTITGVTAAGGLTGGGTSGAVSLGIASGGVTNAMLQNSAVTFSAGQGLTGGGTVSLGGTGAVSVDFTTTQKRVSYTCAGSSAIQAVNQDGTVGCVPIASGIGGSGTQDTVPKFLAGGVTVGSSRISDNGIAITLGDGGSGQWTLVGNVTSPNIVAGHSENIVDPIANPYGATISGGGEPGAPNVVHGPYGTVGGGGGNNVGAYGVVGGGRKNQASGQNAAVGGGENNSATGDHATIVGGSSNTASGSVATVLGGSNNVATGKGSLAAGTGAFAVTDDTFVWSDSEPFVFASTAPNQFLIRASGGVGIGTNNPGQALDVVGNIKGDGLCIGTDCRTTWPSGTGTITGVTAGAGLTGGGASGNVSIGIASGGVTNAMLTNSAVTINAGTGLSGSGVISLGGSGAPLSVDFTATQKRVSNNCTGNTAVQTVNENGTVACVPFGTGTIAGSGTTTRLSRFTSATTLGDSQISDDGINVSIGVMGGGLSVIGDPTAASPSIVGGFSGNSATFGTRAAIGAVIGGGGSSGLPNQVTIDYATIAGGAGNSANGSGSTVSGGIQNTAGYSGATVAGGDSNQAMEVSATVGGGESNLASGARATVPGGAGNTAQGKYSFAAGTFAKALHDGAFVWGDNTFTAFNSTAANQFNVRASGGVRIFSNTALTAGVALAPGGGSWSTLSDRNAKDHFAPVDGAALLKKLNAIAVQTWNYKSQDAAIRHMGPMAQDFAAAFGLGEDDTHISTVDADGVALAGVQALYRMLLQKDEEIAQQRRDLQKLEVQIEALKAAVNQNAARDKDK